MKNPVRATPSPAQRAAAHEAGGEGVALPAVAPLQTPENAPIPAQPVLLNMEEQGAPEQHTLFIHPEDGILWLHSDPQTLSDFLSRKRNRHKPQLTPAVLQVLKEIEDEAAVVHTGKYGTSYVRKGKQKKKGPTAQQRSDAQQSLRKIATLLQRLNAASAAVMKKQRPPSHLQTLVTKTIGSDKFCEQVVMEPLSILRRDDGIEGSHPTEETTLWRSLTNFAGYKRGHMLNEHLHGPGTNDNLVPISTAFNSTMKTTVEKEAKQAVNTNNKVVRFEAKSLNWGSFAGAFGFPDERKLPSQFYFQIRQMKLIPGKDGSHISHWQATGPVLYQATLNHDIPTDVVSGVVAPVVKTFEKGFYVHPAGRIEKATNGNYLLKGNFSHYNNEFVVEALGVEKTGKNQSISETVLTEYQLPPGYQIEQPFAPRKVEYIYMNKILSTTTADRAFIIFDPAKRVKALSDYEDAKKLVIKQQELQKQQAQDLQTRLRLEREEREQKEQLRQQEAREKKDREWKNQQYRRKLAGQVKWELTKYEPRFNGEFVELFHKHLEHNIHKHYKAWSEDEELFNKDPDTLLDPIRQKMEKVTEKLLEKQDIYEEKKAREEEEQEALREAEEKRVLAFLLRRLEEKAAVYLSTLTEEAGISYFEHQLAALLDTYNRYWKSGKVDLLEMKQKKKLDKLLESPFRKLEAIHRDALRAKEEEEEDMAVVPTTRKRNLDDYQQDQQKQIRQPAPFKLQRNLSTISQRNSPPVSPFRLPGKGDDTSTS